MLKDALNDISRQRFFQQNRLSVAFMQLSKHVMDDTGMSPSDVVTAQLNCLVSTVQALSEPSEWNEVAHLIAVAVQQRMTVKGHTH